MAQVSDNLGRFIQGQNVANMTLNEIKGLLAEGLNKPVGAAKPVGTQSKQDPSLKIIKDIFSKFSSQFQKDVATQTSFVKKMMDVLSELKNNKEEKKDTKTKASKSESLQEKFYSSGLKKGSIYVHDVATESVLKNILANLASMSKDISIISKSNINPAKEIGIKPEIKKDNIPADEKDSKKDKLTSLQEEFYSAGLKKGSIYVHDVNVELVLNTILENLQDISKHLGIMSKPSTKLNIKPEVTPEIKPDIKPDIEPPPIPKARNPKTSDKAEEAATKAYRKNLLKRAEILSRIANDISNSFIGIDKPLEKIFSGVIEKERQIIQDTRKIAYEVEGATKNSHALNRTFEDLGKTVALTGKDRQEFAEQYIKLSKVGIKDQKAIKNLTITQLNTEEQLGLKAGDLSDEFQSMFMHLKFNNNQISDMGRGMRDVARNTGLTGEALSQVVKESKQFVDNMRKAGTLTTQSYKNIIEMQANYKKVGIEGNAVIDALSSTNKLLAADGKMFNLLAIAAGRVGLQSELLSGSILNNKKNIKGLSEGFKKIANQFGIAGNTAEEMRENFENLDAVTKRNINITMQSALGVEGGELISQFEAIKETSKTLSDRLSDLNKKKLQNLTLEERANIAEEERKLRLSKSMEVLTALDKAAQSTDNMGSALSKFSKKRGEFEDDLKALGVAWTSETDVARKAITNALESVNKQLKDTGKAELKIDSKNIENALKDSTAFRELTSQINKAEKEASTAAKAQLDPASSAAQSLREINDTLRNLSNQGLSAIFNSSIGKMLVPLIILGTAVASIYQLWQTIGNKFYGWFDGMDSTYRDLLKSQHLNNDLTLELKKLGYTDEQIQRLHLNSSLNFEKAGLNPGSIYTHDTHLEKLLTELISVLRSGKAVEAKPAMDMKALAESAKPASPMDMQALAESAKFTPQKTMMDQAQAIKAKEAKGKLTTPDLDIDLYKKGRAEAEKISAERVAKGGKAIPAEKMHDVALGLMKKQQTKAEGIDPALQKSYEKHLKKKMKLEKTEMVHQQKVIKHEKKELKAPTPEGTGNFVQDMLEQLKGISVKDMAKAAGLIAALGAAVIVLGAAIMFLGKKIMGIMKLDMGTVVETAGVIAAVAAAGAGIAAAGYAFVKGTETEDFQKLQNNLKPKELLKSAAVIGILGPAVVLLGAAIVKLTDMVIKKFKLDISSVAETAGVVVAVAGVAGGLAVAATEALEAIQKFKKTKFYRNPKKAAMDLAKAGGALLLLSGGVVALGASMVVMSEKILSSFKLDTKRILEVAKQMAALSLAVGIISGAVIGAMFGLEALGAVGWEFIPVALIGAAILLGATPVIVALGAAVLGMSEWLIGQFNLTVESATQTGATISAILLSAAAIAFAVLGAVAGLTALGILAKEMKDKYLMLILGAGLFLVMTPLIVALGASVLKMSNSIIGAFDLNSEKAFEIGMTISAILLSAAIIAVGILGAVAGLTALGVLAATWYTYAGFMILGAILFAAMTPIIISLASAVVNLADQYLSASEITSKQAEEVADGLGNLLGSAATIALAIIATVAGLAALGLLATVAPYVYLSMLLGALALEYLTPRMINLASSMIEMASQAKNFNVDESTKIVDGLKNLLSAAGDIAGAIVWAATKMTILGGLALAVSISSWLMNAGAEAIRGFIEPIKNFAESARDFYKTLSSIIDPSSAKKMGEEVADIFYALFLVTKGITTSRDILSSMSDKNFWSWWNPKEYGTVTDQMWTGKFILDGMMDPVQSYAYSVDKFAKQLASIIDPSKAKEMGQGVADVLAGIAVVTSEILKVKDKMVSISNSNVWKLFGYGTVVEQMKAGKETLDAMMDPVLDFAISIDDFSRKLGKYIDPSQAKSMSKGVTDIFEAISLITGGILKVKEKILSISNSNVWKLFGYGTVVEQMSAAKATFDEMQKPVLSFAESIVDFSNKVGSVISPSMAKSMGQGVADIFAGISVVYDEIGKVKDRLLKTTNSKKFWLFGDTVSERMIDGVIALGAMMFPTRLFVKKIVDFSTKVGSIIAPNLAASMGKGVADVLGACSDVTDQIMKIKDKLLTIQDTKGFWKFTYKVSERMMEGSLSLTAMMEPVKHFVKSIVDFSTNIGKIIQPKLAASMGRGVAAVLESVGLISDKIQASKEKLMNVANIADLEKEIKNLENAKNGFEKIKVPILSFMETILNISLDFEKKVNVKQSAKLVTIMQNIGRLIEEVGKVVQTMSKQIIPITEDGYFSKSLVDQLEKAQVKFQGFFSKLADFVKIGIVDEVRNKLSKTGELKNAAKKLVAMAQIISLVGPIIQQLNKNILPLTQGFFSTPEKDIRNAMVTLDGFFGAVGDFVMNAIVRPVNEKLDNPDAMRESAQKMDAMAKILVPTKKAIEALSSVMSLMDPKGFFNKESTMSSIIKNKEQFRIWFGAIVRFVKDGIVAPVNSFGNGDELKTAEKNVYLISNVLVRTSRALTALGAVMALMDKKSWYEASPISKIMSNKDDFKNYFESITIFIRDGIVAPINNAFSDTADTVKAATIMTAMAKTISRVPSVIMNLANAISLMTDSRSFMEKTPVEKIMANKEKFGEYFESISIFVRDGIIRSVLDGFAETPLKSIREATSIVIAMSKIMTAVPKVIRNLSSAMGLLGEEGDFEDSPIGKIQENKDKFGGYFKEIAAFLRDGIVNPILEEIPDSKSIRTAASVMSAMATVIRKIPIVINGLANGLIPLMDSKETLKDAPLPKILKAKDDFQYYFLVVTAFLRDGIVEPILTEMGDYKTIMEASKILNAMARIVGLIPVLMKRLSLAFGLFDPKTTLKEAPIAILASNASMYGEWFYTVATFMRHGILEPLFEGMVMPEEIDMAMVAIENITEVMKTVPYFVSRLSIALDELMESPWFDFGIVAKAVLVSSWFYGIAGSINKGIINPIREMPDADEMLDIVWRLRHLSDAIVEIRSVIDSFVKNLAPLVMAEGWFAVAPIVTIKNSIQLFSEYFNAIVELMVEGVINPLKELPVSDDLFEGVLKLMLLGPAIAECGRILTIFSKDFAPLLDKSWWPFSKSPAQLMIASMAEFKVFFEALAQFVTDGILAPIETHLPSVEGLLIALQKLFLISSVFIEIKNTLTTFSTVLEPLLTKSWWGLGSSPAQTLSKSVDEFGKFWKSMADFITNGILNPIISGMPSSQDIADAVLKLQLTSEAMREIKEVLDSFSTYLQPLIQRSWWPFSSPPIKILTKGVEDFGQYWKSLTYFLSSGIMEPIINNLPSVEDLSMALEKIKITNEILIEIAKALFLLSTTLVPYIYGEVFTEAPLSQILFATLFFGIYWDATTRFLRSSIIDPIINNLPSSEEMWEVFSVLTITTQVLYAVEEALFAIMESLVPFAKGSFLKIAPVGYLLKSTYNFGFYWWGLTNLLDVGLIKPIQYNLPSSFEMQDAEKKMIALTSVLRSVNESLSLLGNIVSMLLDNSIFKITPLGLITSSGSLFSSYWSSLTSFMYNGIINPINENLPNTTELTEALIKIEIVTEAMAKIKEAMYSMAEVMDFTGIGVELNTIDKFYKLLNSGDPLAAIQNTISGSDLGTMALESGEKSTTMVKTIPPMASPRDQMQKEVASTKPTETSISSPELANIASNTEEQVDYNKQMVTLLTQLVNAIGTKSNVTQTGSADSADTSIRKVGNKPFMSAKWPYGAFSQSAGKQVGNIGSGTI